MNAQISKGQQTETSQFYHGHNRRQRTKFSQLLLYLMDARNLSKYLATSFIGRCKSGEQPTASVLFLSSVDHVTELSELELK